MSESFDVGKIGNYYGGLKVKHEDGKYFWGIEDWCGTYFEEIPESLYLELKRFAGKDAGLEQ